MICRVAKTLTLSLLRKHNAQRLDQIERQIQAIETAILAAIEADADLASRFAILTSIPGVSAVTAFALLIAMPELGALDAGQAASLAGLAPIARQSGRWTMKAKYTHLIETGKPAKVALTAIMRKLVVLANALLKANRPWTPRIA
jgi:transposase